MSSLSDPLLLQTIDYEEKSMRASYGPTLYKRICCRIWTLFVVYIASGRVKDCLLLHPDGLHVQSLLAQALGSIIRPIHPPAMS